MNQFVLLMGGKMCAEQIQNIFMYTIYWNVPIRLVGHKHDCNTVVGVLGPYQRQGVFELSLFHSDRTWKFVSGEQT